MTRQAAVALVVAPGDGGRNATLLVILRATVPGDPWSGHIALPGGGAESHDPSLESTARRETLEETGIDLSASPLLAALSTVTPRFPGAPQVTISPFVFRYAGDRRVTISEEVADAWWIPIAELQRPEAWSQTPVEVRDGSLMNVRGFLWRGHTVWGLTERILHEFLGWLDRNPMSMP
jgi:8-oxo-dGTP pyrophosphatase MutT (NUDIX family)